MQTCGFFNQDMLIQGVRDQSSPFADVESSNIHYDNEISNREVLELLSCVKTLKSGVVTCMMAITECIESRRTIYLTQLRKIRDMSNMAIRNAIQNEKAEANSALTRLRNTLELKNNSALEAALVKMHQLETENLELRERIDNLNSVVKELKEKDQDRVVIQNRAVVAALSLRDEEQRQERHQQAQWTETEIARVVAESSLKIQTITLQSKVSFIVLLIVFPE
jgi:vacuolar-type H+-ATPase subunit I/STV1